MSVFYQMILYLMFVQVFALSASENNPIRTDPKSLKKSHKELIQQGHRLYEEGALPEALIRYEMASQLKNKISPNLRYRMASLYYLMDDDEKVIDLLKHKITLSKIPETYYLLGLSYKDLDQIDLARSSFKKYLEKENVKKRNEALYELADIEFKAGKLDESASILSRLAEKEANKRILLALAKVFIRQGNLDRAERILRENVYHDTELYEYALLMGEITVNRGQYQEALDYFSEAKNRVNSYDFELLEAELEAFLILADDFKLNPSKRIHYWHKLHQPLKDLLRKQSPSTIFLAHYYLVTHNLLGDPVCLQRTNELLSDIESIGKENKTKALILQAQLALTYEEKDRLYRLLTAENINSPYVLKGWYLRGLNDLKYGEKHCAPEALNRACCEFEIVWKHCLNVNKHFAGLALKSHLQALLARKTKKSNENAIKLIAAILSQNDLNLPNLDDIFYLRGLAAFDLDPDLAVESFEKAIEYDRTPAAIEALFTLGALHFQNNRLEIAEKIFLKFAEKNPEHQKAPEALFFAAECFSNQDIKKKLFESYPLSPLAAEAYLSYYPGQRYIMGEKEAIDHLAGMPDRFPESPWCIEAYYLLGMDLKRDRRTSSGNLSRPKDPAKALEMFQHAETIYSVFHDKGSLSEQQQYFYTLRCHAAIERALTYMQIAESSKGTKLKIYLEYAKDLLQGMIKELKQSSFMAAAGPYPSLLEECEYHLAIAHIKMHEDREAETILSEMQKEYRKSKITRGYYLSLVYYEAAMIEKRRGQTLKALDLLRQAEDAAKGKVVTSDQLLDIWIQQSLCYLDRCNDEMAMKILSHVINQDVASTQRLKAMFLRSNIYESQGRKELALRQLEALAKQQGEWAIKAKEKLQVYD